MTRALLFSLFAAAAARCSVHEGISNVRHAAQYHSAIFDLTIEGGGGYRFSPDSTALSSPFLTFNLQPGVERALNAAWKTAAAAELSIAPYLSSDLDWSGMIGVEAQRQATTPFYTLFALSGGYYRSSEPLMSDSWDHLLARTRAEWGFKKRNSISVQYILDAINDLPYWTGQHHLRIRAGLRPRTWLSSTIQTGCALARSEEITTAAGWDSVEAYAELSAAASGTIAVRSKNLFSALFRAQWRRYKCTLIEPVRGASPRDETVTRENAFAYAVSLLYCRTITQHIDVYADCIYTIAARGSAEDAWSTIRFSASVAWRLQRL